MKISEKTQRALGALLFAALLFSWLLMILPAGEAIPEDPFESEAPLLQPEPLSSKRSTGFVEQTPPPEEIPEPTEEVQYAEAGGEQQNDGGEGEGEGEGENEPQGPTIVTDLSDRTVLEHELEDDLFSFSAVAVGGENLSVNVRFKNSERNETLRSDGSGHYSTKLKLSELNEFTIFLYQGEKKLDTKRYYISYQRKRADEDNPTAGRNPPTIRTSLDGVTGPLRNQNYTLTVSAFDSDGNPIARDGGGVITVTLDGAEIKRSTGAAGQYEYVLFFPRPNVGDERTVSVTVTADDGRGNSRYVNYSLTVEFPDEGQSTGTAEIYIDASTVGQGMLDGPYLYTIRQGVPAADAVLEMLREYGYEARYDGSVKIGFYLRRISRAGVNAGGEVPPLLWETVRRDGLTLTNSHDEDSIGEWDYTSGSGWMYCVNGMYPGKGLSEWYLNDGDVLCLRFTLAYGKDIGGYRATGGSYGSFNGYCYSWIDGDMLPLGHWFEETERIEPTESEAGYILRTCRRCGEVEEEWPPPLGSDLPEDEQGGST
ncbi:MAG: DUF4430 domain-containing protein [Oscillospiraceae bacterium]|nr:DUF4430 domain-containing protein [Oscillospiraceae bacterium]